ncbi:hypothetical protein [Syntrophobacter fumaroxidans]|uniref:Lipocalin-like domain-containing protein n=1 Tax=Syntrophobacter fumaroxidans (strain DSM 10017 / MPOB) TaxID=335543 RepID=A0LQE9_SYNFM|nr:hypothetical protein [Syntrophobacter fumaroxidans]ABK19651.1 hypothetical protein Sfum_3984 [Syntrophobacter fumaroxidans MPOB]
MKRAPWIVLSALLCLLAASSLASAQDSTTPNLVGVWRAQVPTPWGPATGETALMPDGRFTKTFRAGQVFTWDTGVYTVGSGYIHFDITDHEPKWYNGVRMHWVKSETVFFQMVGPDQMLCEDRITGSRWQAYRVR